MPCPATSFEHEISPSFSVSSSNKASHVGRVDESSFDGCVDESDEFNVEAIVFVVKK
jgi:hypothetical protein